MKLDILEENNEVEKSDDFQSIDYGIAEGQGALLFKILSQYSDPIGSLVREYVTNAFDSHIEADVYKPITVRINENSVFTGNSNTFEVEDYGIGLSPDRVHKIYSKFLASTKREDNSEHGCYGLGSKSGLSYSDMFYVITRYGGEEYVYTIHKGTKAPQIDLMESYPTKETNGTKIMIPIEQGDTYKFKSAIKKQLQYFDNINYENCGIDNDYTIYRGDNFMYREGGDSSSVHIALGKVYYPIDFDVLTQNTNKYYSSYRYKTPIALRFEIGELPVVWNRENIEYTDQTVQKIRQKLEDATVELQNISDKNNKNITSIDDYVSALNNKDNHSLEITDGITIPNIDSLIKENIKYPKYSNLLNGLPSNVFFDYKTHRSIKNGLVNSHKGLIGVNKLLEKDYDLYYCKDKYSTKKNKYINHISDDSLFYIIKKKSDLKTNKELSGRFGFDKGEYTNSQIKLIGDFRKEVDKYIENKLHDYDDVKITDEFEQYLKDQRATPVSKTTTVNDSIPYKPITYNSDDDRYNPYGCYKFNRDEILIKHLVDNSLKIYGHRNDADKLTQIAGIIFSRNDLIHRDWNHSIKEKRVDIFKISKSNVSLIEDLDNAWHVDDFIESNHRLLIKFVTAFYLQDNIDNEIYNLKPNNIEKVKKEFGTSLYNIKYYIQKYYNRDKTEVNDYNKWSILNRLVERKDLLDYKMVNKLKLVEAYFNKYPLFQYTQLDYEDSVKEFKQYMDAKSNIHPLLLERLKQFKLNK